MKIIKFCHNCGKRYYVDKSQQQRSKYCSDFCFKKSKNTKINYKCDYCGADFLIRKSKVDKRLNGDMRYLCCSSECAKNIQKPKWEDIVSLFNSYNYILFSDTYINAKTKLEYICIKHKENGIQSITYNNLKMGFGCKYCGIERTTEAKRLSFEKVKEIFAHNDMLLLDQEYHNTQEKLKYICLNHPNVGVQYMTTSNAYKNHCPYCNIVKGEKKVVNFLMKHCITFEPHKTFHNLFGLGGGKLSYDFYLPDYNILIEYQGEQHERPVEVFGGEKQFYIQQEHDRRKKNYALNNNIVLLEIWYYDFKNIEDILIENLFK